MAKVHGIAGEWARVRGTIGGLWPLFVGVFAAGFATAALVMGPHGIGAVALALVLLYIAWSVNRGFRHLERFYKGARGEERVSEILKGLPEGYHVFNDFLACGRHVDHVVVGPAGVYAVETKFWRGRVTVEEGHILVDGVLPDRPPLDQARREAKLVGEQLAKYGWKGAVTPVLAFASDTFNAQPAELQGTVVINACELKSSFSGGRMVLAPAEVERLVQLMDHLP